MAQMTCKILAQQEVYRGFFRLQHYRLQHSLFAGGVSEPLERELLIRQDAVGVLPYDPVRDEVVLIEQFRVGVLPSGQDPWLLELVAGLIEAGESPEQVAHRESIEESGATLLELVPVHRYFSSPGGSSEFFHLFCGRVDSAGLGGLHGVAEEGEDIKVHVFSVDDALSMMDAGKIRNAHTLMALQWLALKRDMLREQWA